jgi:DNA repair photolyase
MTALTCYAKGFNNSPPHRETRLYENLMEMTERELQTRSSLAAWVSFSSASDPFQPHDDVRDPLIHGLNDSPEMLKKPLQAVAVTGVREVSMSYLYLRPSIMKRPRPNCRAM